MRPEENRGTAPVGRCPSFRRHPQTPSTLTESCLHTAQQGTIRAKGAAGCSVTPSKEKAAQPQAVPGALLPAPTGRGAGKNLPRRTGGRGEPPRGRERGRELERARAQERARALERARAGPGRAGSTADSGRARRCAGRGCRHGARRSSLLPSRGRRRAAARLPALIYDKKFKGNHLYFKGPK